MVRTFLLCTLLCPATVVHAQELKCEIEEKYVCEKGGCKTAPAEVWNLVDSTNRTYARCDSSGCDKYDAQFSQSGIFINIEVNGRGLIAKMATDGSSFYEAATLTHLVYISFGSCKPNHPELRFEAPPSEGATMQR